jgi:Tfp pilus assembly protein PilE
MNQEKGFTLVETVVLVAVVVLISAGLFVWSGRKTAANNSPATTTTNAQSTQSLSTYTSNDVGFSTKYPESWAVLENEAYHGNSLEEAKSKAGGAHAAEMDSAIFVSKQVVEDCRSHKKTDNECYNDLLPSFGPATKSSVTVSVSYSESSTLEQESEWQNANLGYTFTTSPIHPDNLIAYLVQNAVLCPTCDDNRMILFMPAPHVEVRVYMQHQQGDKDSLTDFFKASDAIVKGFRFN